MGKRDTSNLPGNPSPKNPNNPIGGSKCPTIKPKFPVTKLSTKGGRK